MQWHDVTAKPGWKCVDCNFWLYNTFKQKQRRPWFSTLHSRGGSHLHIFKKNMGILKASNRQKKQNVWPLVQLSNEHNLAWKSGNPMETHKNRTTRTYYCSLFLLGWRITWVYMSHMTSKPKNSWINDSISLAAWEWIRDVFTRWAGATGWLMKGWGRYL